ncbi:MAG: prolyl oligopeptidase family serine peptidase [Phycisphaerales bacterium]|nr:prolyl oligopeptidase family serine peptidase [Phycisphaerales bacterium]
MHRNLSVDKYFLDLAAKHTPKYRFNGKTKADWQSWTKKLHAAAVNTLGIMPKKVPLNPEIIAEWTEDGLIKRRLYFDVEENLSVVAYLFRPKNAKQNEKLPAILCCHGHGPYGKESVMGNRATPAHRDDIARTNYDYGLQMAKAGFVTIAIDWRGFGERDDRRKPHYRNLIDEEHGDPCTLNYERSTILGMTLLGMDIHDGSCALDYLCSQSFVDPARIGCMGLSFGGTMTTWMSIYDKRIKAADIICYSDRFADFCIRDANACGSQVTPGLFVLCDVSDLQGLVAPRPLLIEIGIHDDCFLIDSSMSCYRELEKIYKAAGLSDRLELDLFEGGHRWGANKSVAFFKRWLA